MQNSEIYSRKKDVDYVCISDNYWLGKNKPCLTYGLRFKCFVVYFHRFEMKSCDSHCDFLCSLMQRFVLFLCRGRVVHEGLALGRVRRLCARVHDRLGRRAQRARWCQGQDSRAGRLRLGQGAHRGRKKSIREDRLLRSNNRDFLQFEHPLIFCHSHQELGASNLENLSERDGLLRFNPREQDRHTVVQVAFSFSVHSW